MRLHPPPWIQQSDSLNEDNIGTSAPASQHGLAQHGDIQHASIPDPLDSHPSYRYRNNQLIVGALHLQYHDTDGQFITGLSRAGERIAYLDDPNAIEFSKRKREGYFPVKISLSESAEDQRKEILNRLMADSAVTENRNLGPDWAVAIHPTLMHVLNIEVDSHTEFVGQFQFISPESVLRDGLDIPVNTEILASAQNLFIPIGEVSGEPLDPRWSQQLQPVAGQQAQSPSREHQSYSHVGHAEISRGFLLRRKYIFIGGSALNGSNHVGDRELGDLSQKLADSHSALLNLQLENHELQRRVRELEDELNVWWRKLLTQIGCAGAAGLGKSIVPIVWTALLASGRFSEAGLEFIEYLGDTLDLFDHE